MIRILALAIIAFGAVAGATLADSRAPQPAIACTGGGPPDLEGLARLPLIFIADAVTVGDSVNRAPSLVPTSTPATTRTATRGTAVNTPPSPPNATPPPLVLPNLGGVGADLRIVRMIGGPAVDGIRIDSAVRADLERRLRELEVTRAISDCTEDRFVARYVVGDRYLVFATPDDTSGYATAQLYPIEGENIVLDDELLRQSFLGYLGMMPDTKERFFPAVESAPGSGFITAARVPLVSVLRAVSVLRGGPSVTAPVTGSGGMAALRGK